MRRRWIQIIIGLVAVLGIALVFLRQRETSKGKRVRTLGRQSQQDHYPQARSEEIPRPRSPSSVADSGQDGHSTQHFFDDANAYIEEHRREWGLEEDQHLVPTLFENPLEPMLRYTIEQNGNAVWGMHIDFQFDRRGRLVRVDSNFKPFTVVAEKTLPVEDLARRVPSRFSVQLPKDYNSMPILYVTPQGNAHLAYVLPATMQRKNGEEVPVQLMVRASDGQLLQRTTSRGEFHPTR